MKLTLGDQGNIIVTDRYHSFITEDGNVAEVGDWLTKRGFMRDKFTTNVHKLYDKVIRITGTVNVLYALTSLGDIYHKGRCTYTEEFNGLFRYLDVLDVGVTWKDIEVVSENLVHGITSDGKLWSWGRDDPSPEPSQSILYPDIKKWEKVRSMGEDKVVMLSSDGEVYEVQNSTGVYRKLELDFKTKDIATGHGTCLLVDFKNNLYAWETNRLNSDKAENYLEHPTLVKKLITDEGDKNTDLKNATVYPSTSSPQRYLLVTETNDILLSEMTEDHSELVVTHSYKNLGGWLYDNHFVGLDLGNSNDEMSIVTLVEENNSYTLKLLM